VWLRSKYNCCSVNVNLYSLHAQGLINTFQLSSTWLTVNMALGRYIAVCHPLHARGYIRPRGTRVAVIVILLASCVFNTPRFFHYQPRQTPCHWLLMTDNTTSDQPLLAPPPGCDCFYYSKVFFYSSGVLLLAVGQCFCRSIWIFILIHLFSATLFFSLSFPVWRGQVTAPIFYWKLLQSLWIG